MRLPETTRRVFLRRSLQALGALVAAPVTTSGCAPGTPDAPAAPAELRALGATDWVVLEAVTDTLVPRGGAFATGARDIELATRIDTALARSDPALAQGVASALWLIEWIAGPMALHFGRFSRASFDDRTAIYRALAESRIGLLRQVHAGLKQLCLLYFYTHDASWKPIGYDGPWLEHEQARS